MKLHKFIKNVSETYFLEKDAVWSKRERFLESYFYNFFFIIFTSNLFCLYRFIRDY